GEEYMAVLRLKKQENQQQTKKNQSIEAPKTKAEPHEPLHFTPKFQEKPETYYWEVKKGTEKRTYTDPELNLTLEKEGIYTITLFATYSDGTEQKTEQTIEIKKINILENQPEIYEQEVAITPNPATSYIHIKGTKEGKKITIEIIDTNGRLLQKQEGITTMNIQSLAPGVYFIKIKQEGKTTVKKMIKI
ncbi:T9SS type A sorting domain-containing protein, partial [Apibacter muscae]|uniref:T9SS type A sorting domain-containing protein n=1 Tax=Apibacter muscae TaxID=2509004 RepID=UPI0011ADE76B